MILTLIWVVVLIATAVLFLRQAYATFDRYEIKYVKAVPILSDLIAIIRPKEHIGLDLAKTYNSFPNERRGMERNAFHFESCVHELQDTANGAFHGGGRRSNDSVSQEEDRKFKRFVCIYVLNT
ncbi:hypothetical protein HF086_012123 [Spodoptera exigua]|uniref:Uncharacterized protein n=1 Tax=Spodoptera exigua TaxID=7107 RepID=A0A922SPF7_SPOEX|nr:hypothetical protein HF086_012123 [Spodoptera exigua]